MPLAFIENNENLCSEVAANKIFTGSNDVLVAFQSDKTFTKHC